MLTENKNNYILKWLMLITLLVAIMIIIGGLTRLTDSGLSITKWNLFTGIIPPFTPDKWNEVFLLYKEIPEFYLEKALKKRTGILAMNLNITFGFRVHLMTIFHIH